MNKIERALYMHLVNCDGSNLARMLPFYYAGKQCLLSPAQRKDIYVSIRGWVKTCETSHFKRAQKAGTLHDLQSISDYRDERVLLFYERLPYVKWPDTTKTCVTAAQMYEFKINFSRYEALLQFRRLGISLGDETNPIKLIERTEITTFIMYFSWIRSNHTEFIDFYYARYGKVLSNVQLDRWHTKFRHLDEVISHTVGMRSYLLLGFTERSRDINMCAEHKLIQL